MKSFSFSRIVVSYLWIFFTCTTTMKSFVSKIVATATDTIADAIDRITLTEDEYYEDDEEEAAEDVVSASKILYVMPHENDEHEGTWLQWPHSNEYGKIYRDRIQSTWIEMTTALYENENVHIVAYDKDEITRIKKALIASGLSSPLPKSIDFFIAPTNDVWVRDNGPVFARNNTPGSNQTPIILDWGFNGWGKKYGYTKSDKIPSLIGKSKKIPIINVNNVVLEGGAVELDGDGTLMATQSSTTHKSRNPKFTIKQIESYYTKYLGVTKFIWLKGVAGGDVTDMHIDGLMKFVNSTTIVTTSKKDLQHYLVPDNDIDILLNSTNRHNKKYNYVLLPLTKKNVITKYGNDVGYKGTYINYYVANNRVLMPSYNDVNDIIAQSILQSLYPNRVVISINCQNLFKGGGMVHCVTQQQPK